MTSHNSLRSETTLALPANSTTVNPNAHSLPAHPQFPNGQSAETPSTGTPVTFGSVVWYKSSVSADSGRSSANVQAVDCPDQDFASRIKYVINVHDAPQTGPESSAAPGTSGSSPSLFLSPDLLSSYTPSSVHTHPRSGQDYPDHLVLEECLSTIEVDHTIALDCARLETTALKNRMVLCGLTLTIPLFLYLRFTIWSQ